ncbi:hypothetical protein ID866_5218 [Astraeus odoratus]|nr:hypothetical protein ID866_5218 [Astraeus odoratus]
MSLLRIRIPKGPAEERSSQPSASTSTSARRKSLSKRPLVPSDDEADSGGGDADTRFEPPRVKRARTVDSDGRTSIHLADPDMDMQVDVTDDAGLTSSVSDDRRFLPDDNTDASIPDASPLHASQPKKKGKPDNRAKKTASVSGVSKPKRRIVSSDDDADVNIEDESVDDDFVEDGARAVTNAGDDEDDDFEVESGAKRGGSSKGKVRAAAKSTVGKGKSAGPKSTKSKSNKEKEWEKDVLMKDERKLLVPAASTSRASSVAAQAQASDVTSEVLKPAALTTTSNVIPDAAATPTAADKDPTDPLLTKKRKLPTIKKNKQPGTTGTTPSGSNTSAHSKPPPVTTPASDLVKPPLPTMQQRKSALSGAQDFDLRDEKTYDALFKGGGSASRSGLSRREKEEERRKELNRMRDEARAKRTEEAKYTFDLQAQAEKIARFERRLRAENSSVLHPNFLAAKFRDEWEMERRRRRDDRGAPKEEGEA